MIYTYIANMAGLKDQKSIEVDFGEVEVGVTKIKSIKIANNSCHVQTYVVQRDSISNPLDCVFNTIEYTWSLMPCESYVCDICYRPILPNCKYTDYFFIIDSYNCYYKIVVRGSSAAANVTCSHARLIIASDINCSANKCVKLMNTTKIPAKFSFDFDANQCPFRVNELSGIIKPLSSKTIDISFQPISRGIYKYYMPCLILHQRPIIIELFGLCELEQYEIRNFFMIVENIPELDVIKSFTDYMNDTTAIIKDGPPAICLSWSFIDFGEVPVGPKNLAKRTPQTVCLTNNGGYEIFISWDTDKSSIFNIRPQEARVRDGQSIIFEVRFDPIEKLRFYSCELLARVFRIPCCTGNDPMTEKILSQVVPESMSIRLIGHTYSSGTNDWIPQYEIPETVTMPACVPALPVYNTFIMRNFGQQPLMFHFVSPSTTHFSVKPVMGLITPEQEYQVIVVELFPDACAEPAYVERWGVRLNGNSKNEIYMDLQGFAELASMMFGDDNSLTFDPVYLGCKETRTIPVRNLSRHLVRFEYLAKLPKELSIDPMSGIINPNETVFHQWTFVPDLLKCYEFEVTCRLTTDVGERCSVEQIEASGSCTRGSLMAIPEELDFGEVLYGETCEMEFKIFNFSPVEMNYQLTCRPTKSLDIMNNSENDLKLSPTCGQIAPGKGDQVQVIFNPTYLGFYELTIEYSVISNASEDVLLPLTDPKSLCRVICTCYLPTLKVKDLLYRVDVDKGISKISLWKSLCIDGLNKALRESQPPEERLIHMNVPAIRPNEKLDVKLLFINLSPIEVTCCLKKKKTCFCDDTTVVRNRRNSRNGCANCVDDRSIEISPNKMKMTPNETCVLTISVRNHPLHPAGVYWDLSMGDERCITLNLNIDKSFILPSPYLTFRTVDIRESPVMRYQAIWLYNNSENEVSYAIKTKALAHINKRNYSVIYTCLNPKGIIQGWERKPVLFGFCPNKYGKFDVKLLVKLDGKQATLKIEAECTNILNKIPVFKSESCPQIDTFKTSDIIAYFNNDYLTLPPIPTHGKIVRLIMLHNHHQYNVFSYEWKNYEIENVVKVKIEPPSGLIQPQSLLTFLVDVHVSSYECLLDIDVRCHFVNVTEKRLAERKKRKQECILKGMEGEFTINEKGISYPEKPVFEPIKEPSQFWKALTLKIDVRNFYDPHATVHLDQQLNAVPAVEESYDPISDKKIAPDIVQMSLSIFENIVWEIINNPCFFKMAEEYLMKTHKLKYSQLPKSFGNRKKYLQSKRLDWIPPKKLTDRVLQSMIRMITHQEFNLDISHFSYPPDVRQISYQKIYLEAFYKQAFDPTIDLEMD